MSSAIGEKLRMFRERAGMSAAEVAEAAGVGVNTYYDLESCNDLFMTVSLDEIVRLTRVLGTKPDSLFFDAESSAPSKITLRELSGNVREFIRSERIEAASFEESCGWEVSSFLIEPQKAYGWNIDCLRDVCNEAGIDWRSALPGE